jgi:hypothetical protein
MASTAQTQNDKSKFGGEHMADQAKVVANAAIDTAKDVAAAAAKKAGEAASCIGHKAEDATSTVGGGMKSLAGSIREHTPREGMLGHATSAVADTLESGGRYLQEHGLSGVGEDVTGLIRRNPIPAVLIGIGIGYLIARATRS